MGRNVKEVIYKIKALFGISNRSDNKKFKNQSRS